MPDNKIKEKSLLFLLLIFVFSSVIFAETDLKNRLLNYKFERVKLTNAAKSLIIDKISQSQHDSINEIVKFCDSINFPDSSWLSNRDRFNLLIIRNDTVALDNFDYYKNIFKFSDTLLNIDKYYYRHSMSRGLLQDLSLIEEQYYTETENLSLFLYKKSKEIIIASKNNKKSEISDFLFLLFNMDRIQDDSLSIYSKEFLDKYPKGKYARIVDCNFINSKSMGNVAFAMNFGAGELFLGNNTNKLFNDYVAFSGEIEFFYKTIPLNLSFDIMTLEIKDSLKTIDTMLVPNTKVNISHVSLNTGKMFILKNNKYITPHFGLSWAHFNPLQYQGNGDSLDAEIISISGYNIGLSFEKALDIGNGSGLTSKIDIGLYLEDFSEIKSGLSANTFYLKLLFGYSIHPKKRVSYFD